MSEYEKHQLKEYAPEHTRYDSQELTRLWAMLGGAVLLTVIILAGVYFAFLTPDIPDADAPAVVQDDTVARLEAGLRAEIRQAARETPGLRVMEVKPAIVYLVGNGEVCMIAITHYDDDGAPRNASLWGPEACALSEGF